jgi:hypothetical protein
LEEKCENAMYKLDSTNVPLILFLLLLLDDNGLGALCVISPSLARAFGISMLISHSPVETQKLKEDKLIKVMKVTSAGTEIQIQ